MAQDTKKIAEEKMPAGDITKCRMRHEHAGIICMEPEEACERCGWNPAEEARRKAQLKRKFRKDG